jgi:hypothetical protein
MTSEANLLLEEYKILETRYRGDTNRIWTQAQILIAANLIVVTATGSWFGNTMLCDATNSKIWLVDPRLVVAVVAGVGFFVSLAWFFSLATDAAYQELSLDLLRGMEHQLDLPIKVFSKAKEKAQHFNWWQRIGGIGALYFLSLMFAVIWFLIEIVVWQITPCR